MKKERQLMEGLPVVISAPSGGGKTTIANQLLKSLPDAVRSISCTTREPRPNEKEGTDYFFVSVPQFKEKIEKNELMEWAEVHGHFYGTPLKSVQKKLKEGLDVLLTIDPQGAVSIRRLFPEGIFIFVVPPSWKELRKRLNERGGESPESIDRRLVNARKEIGYLHHYDYLVTNEDLESAVENVRAILTAEHSRLKRMQDNSIPFVKETKEIGKKI